MEEKETFQVRFNKAATHISDVDIAQRLGISRMTVQKWRSGHVTPHPIMEDSIFILIQELAIVYKTKC